jgi:hypothetical protein
MYVWIWRHLPGNIALRLLQTVVLIAIVSGLLLFVVFPWLEPKLWFTHVTVNQ